jgi:hypothetical protein
MGNSIYWSILAEQSWVNDSRLWGDLPVPPHYVGWNASGSTPSIPPFTGYTEYYNYVTGQTATVENTAALQADIEANPAIYNAASFIYYPSSYSYNKVYGIKPATSDGELTVVRNGGQSRIDDSKLFSEIGYGIPLIDYTYEKARLQFTEETVNLALSSLQLNDGAVWVRNDVYATAFEVPAPDGSSSFAKHFCNGVDPTVIQTISGIDSTTEDYTASIYIASGTSDGAQIELQQSGTTLTLKRFALLYGTADLSVSGNTLYVQNVTSNYIRVSLSARPLSTADIDYVLKPYINSNTTDTYFCFWGAQFEKKNYATNLIPTYGSTSNRVTTTGEYFNLQTKSIFGATNGAAVFDFAVTDALLVQNNPTIKINEAGATALELGISSGATPGQINIISNLVTDSNSSRNTVSKSIGDSVKVGFHWDENNISLAIDGTLVVDEFNMGQNFVADRFFPSVPYSFYQIAFFSNTTKADLISFTSLS